jgi:Putative phage serine protease XkdF
VESFIARKDDQTFIPDSWVVGVHVNDDTTWGKVKKGEINGFSLEALVLTEDQEVEIEVPPVISGRTDKVDGHEHEFYAAFDEEGKFLGGRTNMIDGHFHVIKSGTLTETAKEHSHRFSMMDDIVIVD